MIFLQMNFYKTDRFIVRDSCNKFLNILILRPINYFMISLRYKITRKCYMSG